MFGGDMSDQNGTAPVNMLDQIQQKRLTEKTYNGGGHPHTFVELFGGHIVPMISVEPDVFSFRHNYYYNSADNNLYTKKAEWVVLHKAFDNEDTSYVYYDGRSVKKMVNDPDPENFGDKYYFSIKSNKVYGRMLKWVKCTNS
jgi:hypothetical protein